MKAILMDRFGGPEVLRLDEVPDPVAGPGEVVVDVHAASVNPADWHFRENADGSRTAAFPHILGRDLSGIVREVGPDVSDFVSGDAVFGVTDRGQDSAYAEAVAINAGLLAAKPDFLSHTEAAAVSLVGLTALVALEDTARLQPGETLLIHGGAGGVGSFAIQYAKHVGATVLTTASSRNHEYVRELGADEAIDYHKVDFAEVALTCDVVFDTIGGDVFARSFAVLAPRGRLVHIAPGPPGFEPPRADVTVVRPHVARDRAHLERIVELMDSGAVRVPPLRVWPLEQAAEAQEHSRTGPVRGKLVLEVRSGADEV